MTLVPEKLFVNLYAPSIGPCVGSAYPTKEDADRFANSHRLLCIELGARTANAVVLSDDLLASLNSLAKQNECTVAQVIESAIAVHKAIPNEIRVLLRRYAAEQHIKLATAIAECCRGYLTKAAR